MKMRLLRALLEHSSRLRMNKTLSIVLAEYLSVKAINRSVHLLGDLYRNVLAGSET